MNASDEMKSSLLLKSSLERYEQQAGWWQYGWMGVHTATTVVEGLEAGRTSNKSKKRAHTVSSLSAALGMADVLINPLYPLTRKGSNEEDAQQLERRMETLVDRIERRTSWLGHLEGWLTALIGGVVMAAGHGKDSDAIEFFVISGLVTELEIWSLPRQAVADLENYKKKRDSQPVVAKNMTRGKPIVQVIPHGLTLRWLY